MMGLFGKNDVMGKINFETPERQTFFVPAGKSGTVFIELEGAMGRVDEESGKLEFYPRGRISIAVDKIGAYYDNTIILFGNKIRVMETSAQIAVKIMEALK